MSDLPDLQRRLPAWIVNDGALSVRYGIVLFRVKVDVDVMGPRPVSDKRVERSKAKVLAETYRQMAQSGIGGLSIDEVSRASGVSKTTIYRHWPSRSALLIDACSRLSGTPEAPDSGSLKEDLRTLLSYLADQLETANWSSVYPSVLDAAERDPEISAMQQSLHQGFMAPFVTVLARARERGEIAPDDPHPDLIAMLVGPLFFRRWFSRERIDAAFIDGLIGRYQTTLR